jgi:HK97 family phage portal protein
MGGPGSRSPLILTGGLEPAQLSVNSKDAEILGTRMFGVVQICAILGVPPYMIGSSSDTSQWGTGMAEQGGNFVRYTLRRHLTPIAQELNRKLWPVRQRYFVAYETEALESGDTKARAEAYRIALGRAGEPGWMTQNQVRRAENMPPVEGGDQLFNGAKDAPAETAGQQQEPA